ncbi:MAG: glycosyltransferase [Paludibacteraceae bacterium]|nr:glycosyltransferase [Paludibacteraceae bacterium]
MQPKVSVIMPVYNAGRLFRPCVESILRQTLRDLELVMVLDCPTDGTAELAELFAREDNRVKLVRNDRNLNIGLSRNAGLAAATGEYVGFSDHDDLMEPDMFERLYQRAEATGADVVMCHYSERRRCEDVAYRLPACGDDDVRQQVLDALIEAQYASPSEASFRNVNSVWTELIRRSVITDNGLKFPDNRVTSYEDALFNVGLFACARKAVILPQVLYHHLLHGENAFGRYEYKSVAHMLAYADILAGILRRYGLQDSKRQLFRTGMVRRLYTSMYNELRFKGWRSLPDFFRQVRSHAAVQQILSGIRIAGLRPTQRIFVLLCRAL